LHVNSIGPYGDRVLGEIGFWRRSGSGANGADTAQ
jgi:hypothetical protein